MIFYDKIFRQKFKLSLLFNIFRVLNLYYTNSKGGEEKLKLKKFLNLFKLENLLKLEANLLEFKDVEYYVLSLLNEKENNKSDSKKKDRKSLNENFNKLVGDSQNKFDKNVSNEEILKILHDYQKENREEFHKITNKLGIINRKVDATKDYSRIASKKH